MIESLRVTAHAKSALFGPRSRSCLPACCLASCVHTSPNPDLPLERQHLVMDSVNTTPRRGLRSPGVLVAPMMLLHASQHQAVPGASASTRRMRPPALACHGRLHVCRRARENDAWTAAAHLVPRVPGPNPVACLSVPAPTKLARGCLISGRRPAGAEQAASAPPALPFGALTSAAASFSGGVPRRHRAGLVCVQQQQWTGGASSLSRCRRTLWLAGLTDPGWPRHPARRGCARARLAAAVHSRAVL